MKHALLGAFANLFKPDSSSKNADGFNLPEPTFICIAIKPQMIPKILPKFSHYGNGLCVFLSIAAGVKISSFEALLGQKTTNYSCNAKYSC